MKRAKQLIQGLGLVASLLFSGSGGLSAQALEWAFAMGESDGQSRLSSAVNADGQVYTAGTFSGTIDFDPSGGTANLSASARASVFVAQTDAEGQLAWAKAFGGPGESRAQAIALDADGFLYLTGYFTGVVDFDPGAGAINLNAGDTWQPFVAKLDAQGNGVWAKRFASNPGPRSSGMGWALAVSEAGEVYLHGHFSGTLDFDPNAGSFPLSAEVYEEDAFLLKLSSAGNFLWVRQLSGSLRNGQPSLAVDGNGNAFLAGYFQDTLQLSAGAAPVVSSGCSDAFAAKWDAAGQLAWVLPMGGTRWDAAKHLAVDEEGWAYVTGYFSGTASFGNAQLSSIGETDAFAVRIDPSGQVAWAKQMGGSQADEGAAIALDAQGYMYLGGRFRGSADFSPTAGALNALGQSDIFLAKFNQEDGEAVWALRVGGLGEEDLQALLIDADNSLYLLGGFEGQLLFDPMLQGSPLTASTTQDRFAAKIRQCFRSQATVAAYVCESYTLNGQTYSSSGIYEQLLTNANGCDSLLTLELSLNEPTTATISASACESYTLNGQTYSSSGTYEQLLTNANGCDSLLTLELAINEPTTATLSASACNSYTLNGQTYSSSGTYEQLLANASGCDSLLTLELVINEPTTATFSASACNSYTLNGQTYSSSGTYEQVLTSANGCDSLLTLELAINEPTTATISASACESYTLNGQTYSSSGTYEQVLTNANGCDSLLTLVLAINEPTTATISASACNSYTLNDQTYSSSGTYEQVLASANGCDSVLTLVLAINEPTTAAISASACESYTLNDQTYSSSGTYQQMLTNANGCDSLLTLELSINEPTTTTISASACNSYTLNGQTYSSSGTYQQMLTNANGCDSLLTLVLAINEPTTATISASACNSYTLNGQTYSSSGTYEQVLASANGCDSLLTLVLAINEPTTATLSASACNSYTLNGQTYSSSGTYEQLLTNANGCDSLLTLVLAINEPTTATISASACNSYTLNGQTYSSSGTYEQVLASANGCDSLLTLVLAINEPTTATLSASACQSYTLNGQTYSSSGTYEQVLTSANGCDSLLTLELAINEPTTATISASACESYTLNDQTYSSSGTYQQMLTNANGCDSLLTLELSINEPTTTTISVSACGSYSLNGQTYSSSGTYEQVLTNANGCDSLLTLVLAINEPTTTTISVSACGSYSLNGQTYSSSGTYEQVLTNANGCDSLLTLVLAISQLTLQLEIIQQASCEDSSDGQIAATVEGGVPPYRFLWSDGQSTALASDLLAGLYELTLTDEAGCEQTASVGITAAFNPELTVQSQGNRLFVEKQGYDYQWVDCNTGEPIPGATASFYLAERSGRYAIVARSEGCEQQSICWPVIVEQEQLFAYFFPNPNEGRFTLFVPDAAKLTVYNAIGQRLYVAERKEGMHEMELAHLPSGYYLMLLEYERGQQTLTWIKL